MKTIADVIIDRLNDFGGFDHWWHDCQPEDKQYIKKALNKVVDDFSGNKPEVVKNKQT